MKNTYCILRCEGYAEERKIMMCYMGELVDGWQGMDDQKKIALVKDLACTDDRVGRKWKRFGELGSGETTQLTIDCNSHHYQ